MRDPDVFALKRSGLNQFLFATVGVEASGTTLSVASVFARLNRDPWAEAGALAQLPEREAISSLARTIVGMPASAWTLADATTIATRLVALLPTRPHVTTPDLPTDSPQTAARHVRMAVLLAGLGLAVAYGVLATRNGPRFDGVDMLAVGSADSPAPSHHTSRVGSW